MHEESHQFLAWLEFCVSRVKDFEAEIKKQLALDDEEAYKQTLLDKAMFIASLAKEGQAYLHALKEGDREFVKDNLANFSEHADWALKLKSYFYMSALLYPDEHRPGAPNYLDVFAAEMRGRLA